MSSNLRAAASNAARLALRSVHIKLYPTAATFAERKEVLRVVQRFGEVEWFKSLKYEPVAVDNAFLALFKEESAAKNLIEASPLRYHLVSSSYRGPSPTSDGNMAGIEVDSTTDRTFSPMEKVFEIRASPTRHPHEDAIRYAPLYGPWTPKLGKMSRVVGDLRERVPVGVPREGLCDWETAKEREKSGVRGTNEDEAAKRAEQDFRRRFGEVAEGEGSRAGSVPWRILRKERALMEAYGRRTGLGAREGG